MSMLSRRPPPSFPPPLSDYPIHVYVPYGGSNDTAFLFFWHGVHFFSPPQTHFLAPLAVSPSSPPSTRRVFVLCLFPIQKNLNLSDEAQGKSACCFVASAVGSIRVPAPTIYDE